MCVYMNVFMYICVQVYRYVSINLMYYHMNKYM